MEFLIALFEALGLYTTKNGLAEHLRGMNLICEDLTLPSIYKIVFAWLFCINTIVIFNYYYGFFNRSPFNRWGWWLTNVIVSSIAIFFVAFIYPYNDLTTGYYCKQLSISIADCIGFGFTTVIFSIVWCILLSIAIKWKSNVNKKVPF